MSSINPSQATQPTLHYRLYGNGPEHVVVMHDWNGDHSSYLPALCYLDDAAFTYAFVDLRGYGGSRDIAGEYSVREIADDCLGVADAAGWQRFHLIGHSMTGMAAQRLAVDAPERIKSAIAVCPMSAAGSNLDEQTFAFFASTTEDEAAFCRLIKFVTGGLSDQWARAKRQQFVATVAPACRLGYLNMFSRTDFADEVRGNSTPFLVLVGDKDPGLDATAMQATFMSWHTRAEMHVLNNCGHYPMQECPPYFAGVIEAFLRRHSG